MPKKKKPVSWEPPEFYVKHHGKRRYEKVRLGDEPFMPCDGIWLVRRREGCLSQRCIMQIGDLPNLYPYANLALDSHELAMVINSNRLNDPTRYAPQDIADTVLKWIATKAAERSK